MNTDWVQVEVHCRSDYTYAQEPRAVTWPDGFREAIELVEQRWVFPAGRSFRVRAPARSLELCYLQDVDVWQARVIRVHTR